MEYIIFFFILIVGIYLIIFKSSYVIGYIQLYQMEDYYCIERFRKSKKVLDLMTSVYNASWVFFGLNLLVVSTFAMDFRENLFLAIVLNTISTLFFLTLWAAYMLIGHFMKFRDQMNAIKEQWKTQHRISEDNDHEVRNYRLLKLVLDTAPKWFAAGTAINILIHIYLAV